MKKTILLTTFALALVCTSFLSFATTGMKDNKKFIETTTLFVLDGSKPYNAALQKVVADKWKVTPYKFISPNEVDQYISKKEYSVACRSLYQRAGKVFSDFFILVNGGRKSLSSYQTTDGIALELMYMDENDAVLYLPNILERISDEAEKAAREARSGKTEKREDMNAAPLKDKVLYIPARYLDAKKLDAFKTEAAKDYAYKFEVVSDEDLKEAIYEGREDVGYVFKNSSQIFVMDAATGKWMLLVACKKPDRMVASDMNAIAKAVRKDSK